MSVCHVRVLSETNKHFLKQFYNLVDQHSSFLHTKRYERYGDITTRTNALEWGHMSYLTFLRNKHGWKDGLDMKNSRFSTNTSLYLGNGTRLGYSYYGTQNEHVSDLSNDAI